MTYYNDDILKNISDYDKRPAMIKKQDVDVDIQNEIDKCCVKLVPVMSSTIGFLVARIRKREER